MGKAWPALDIHVPGCDPQLQELVLAELDDFQPTAVQEPDDTSRLRAFFATAESRDGAARALAASFGSHLFVEAVNVDDKDWAARSQAQLRPITIGRLVVAPPWGLPALSGALPGALPGSDPRTVPGSDPDGPSDGAPGGSVRGSDPIVVVIRPSMGFGTGHHATTRLALKALLDLPLDSRAVLDVGCGSGVLAIAAVKLGAKSALGIDIDRDALENATENAALNNVSTRVRFEEGDFRAMPARADIVMANLTGGLLERSAETLSACVAPGGFLIASGFMASEKTAVIAALDRFLALQSIAQEDEWVCAMLARSR